MSTELRVVRKLGALRPATPQDTDLMSLLPEGMPIKIVATIHPRNQKAHAWFFGLLGVVAEATDKSIDSLLDEIKLGIGHTNKIVMSATGEVRETPRSISWAAMDEPTFKIFRERAIDYIMTDIMPGVEREDLVREVEERISPNDNYQRSEAAGGRAANNAGGGMGGPGSGRPLPSEARGR